MLKLPQEHTNDKKANTIIAWYLNQNILGLVKDIGDKSKKFVLPPEWLE